MNCSPAHLRESQRSERTFFQTIEKQPPATTATTTAFNFTNHNNQLIDSDKEELQSSQNLERILKT